MKHVISPSLSEQLKVTIFLPVLDAMLFELEQRLCSRSPHFFETNHIAPLADSYSLDKIALPMECSLAISTP